MATALNHTALGPLKTVAGKSIFFLGTMIALAGAPRAFALTWVLSSAPTNQAWSDVACSADFRTIIAVGNLTYFTNPGPISGPGAIYTSTNRGLTWVSNNVPGNNWTWTRCSADGTTLLAYNGARALYISTNAGDSWSSNYVSLGFGEGVPSVIAASSDCSKLVGFQTNAGWIETSTNRGVNWSLTTAPTFHWNSVASSGDGTRLIATVGYPPGVYVSADSGNTWKACGAFTAFCYYCCSSIDGKKLAVLSDGIYTSTDAGVSWEKRNAPLLSETYNILSSSDGTRLLAYGQSVVISTDSGNTWAAPQSGGSFSPVSASADACALVAHFAIYYAGSYSRVGIFISQTPPSPQLGLSAANDGLTISWQVPSQDFVAQQSLDLSSWTDLTNDVVFDLQNVRDGITLPMANSNSFFRLRSP